jgi:hypothetical protein
LAVGSDESPAFASPAAAGVASLQQIAQRSISNLRRPPSVGQCSIGNLCFEFAILNLLSGSGFAPGHSLHRFERSGVTSVQNYVDFALALGLL